MYQSKTLRRLPPTARQLARMANTLELEVRRLRRLVLIVSQHEQVYAHVTRPKPQAELAPEGCLAHLGLYHEECPDCADALFKGTGTLSARVMREATEVPSD